MKKTFLALALIAAAFPAFARPVDVSWVLPTTFDDGSVLNPATDLSAVRVYANNAVVAALPGTATATTVELPTGSYTIYATVVSTEGVESLMSNTDEVVVQPRRPNPPTLIEAIVAFLKRIFGWFA